MQRSPFLIPLAAVLLGFGLAACDKKEESLTDQAIENVRDGLDLRENEKLKDAGEDAADAMRDAGEAVKEKAEEVKEDLQK